MSPRNAGLHMQTVCQKIPGCLVSLLLVSATALAAAQGAKQVAPAESGRLGTVVRQELGDVACYLTMRDDAGRESTEMADFDLCTKNARLVGKKVELGFTQQRVMDESCGGDPACKKSRQVQVATTVRVISDRAESAPAKAVAGQVSFCAATEVTVFACRTGAKLVSVCADPASGPTKGYLQYRFGKPDSTDALELNWPERWSPPARVATGSTESFSGGGAAWLRIRKGDYAYVVFTGIGRWGPGGATQTREGITVERSGKADATLRCAQPAQSMLGPDWFARVGVESRGESFDLPD